VTYVVCNTTNDKALGLSYQFHVLMTMGVAPIWYLGINPLNFKQTGVYPTHFLPVLSLILSAYDTSVLSSVFCLLSKPTDHSSQNLLS